MSKELLEMIETNPLTLPIADALLVTNLKVKQYRRISCSISGGADSDIMLDVCSKVDPAKKIRYVFFDTGIEYEATKKHLDYLEEKYGITIERIRPKIPVPLAVRRSGVPFLSKLVSTYIGRLQAKGFQWETGTFEELNEKYPGCQSALKWWCNAWGEKSRFNIERFKYLKEFIQSNPRDFPISDKCCTYAKKNTAKDFEKANQCDVSFVGIRKSENGIRSSRIKNCFTPGEDHDNFRPIFWFTDDDKSVYKSCFEITHSDCYEVYGLKRTGCAGCPFGSNFEEELRIIEQYEPRLFKAVNHIFGKSYDYTRRYREFKANYKPENKNEGSR